MSELVCKEESFDECSTSIETMLHDHWNEVGLHKSNMPLAPNWSAYRALEDAGLLRIFTAREDGSLVGYAVFLVQKHLHYKYTTVASNDLLYLKPSHRKGSTGFRLIKAAHEMLRLEGVDKITWHAKVQHDFGVLLKRLGYEPEETIWGKYVGD